MRRFVVELKTMNYAIRPMQLEDVLQVTEIDREAFLTLQPATSFKRELRHNKIARYFVVYEVDEQIENESSAGEEDPSAPKSRLDRIMSAVKRLFSSPPPTKQRIVGFAGMWFMANEAHLTTIAVREAYKRQGIGKLLLTSAINTAIECKAKLITLEVRSSNLTAQALYEKYGFYITGQRRGYYSDTKEDALIMATDTILSDSFQSNYQQLKKLLPPNMLQVVNPLF